jgi:Fic family protein
MAIMHYQFECIHPYKKGNGRIGRILNIMALVNSGRLSYPILNLSKFFDDTKEEYFSLLEKCHNDISYLDEFIIYVLKGIYETSTYTINFIHQINRIIENTKKEFKRKQPTLYSDALIEHLFKFPYTKNELLRNELNLSRSTATKYLKTLVELEFLESEKYGKEIVYKNKQLVNLFQMN